MAETIAEIEIFAITPRIAERYSHRAIDYHGLDQRTCYKVTTSSGVIGWGESRGSPELAGQGYGVYGPRTGAYSHLVGMALAEALHRVPAVPLVPAQLTSKGNRNHDAGVECALYDALGKHLKVPVHALLGRKLRDWVPVAAWTIPCSPADFAADVQRAVDDGYMAMKMHTSPFYDVFDQTRAAEAVAPPVCLTSLSYSKGTVVAVVQLVKLEIKLC
jgi:L-alanine-DL-glutamate epimerase-like enolase superfamily enzyme